MKNIVRSILILASALALNTACTEKIDLKLKNADPQVVIEGNLSDQPGPHYVIVTKSKRFDENNTFAGVPDALVIISDDAGNTDTLTQPLLPGLYLTSTMQGVVGRRYHLQVTVEGVTYESYSTMQPPVDIDSVLVYEETNFQGETETEAEIVVRDPLGVRNCYRVVSYRHERPSTGFNVQNDRLWDGKLRNFNVPDDDDLVAGDTLRVDLWSIDEQVHTYFDQFNSNQNNFGAPAAPANPDPVFVPATLGYFSAHSIKSKTLIVQ